MKFSDVLPRLSRVMLGVEGPVLPGSIPIPNKAKPIKIITVWHAEIGNFFRDDIGVSVVRSDEWQKGVLWLPKGEGTTQSSAHDELEYTFSLVNLTDWNDPVITALHTVDLAPSEVHWSGAEGSYQFELLVSSGNFYASISHDELPKNESLFKLWDSVITTIEYLSNVCDNDEIKNSISTSWVYRRYLAEHRHIW